MNGLQTTAELEQCSRTLAGPRPSRRTRRVRAAAYSLFWGAVLFAAMQALLSWSSHTWAPELRDPPFWTKVHRFRERLEAAAPKPLSLVMFGSSCTANGFHGKLIEEELAAQFDRPLVAFNLGVHGRGPLSSLVHLQRLVKAGLKPDIALIEVFPFVLPARTTPHDANPTHLVWPELETVAPYHDQDLTEDYWKSVVVPVSGQRKNLVSAVAPKLLPLRGRVEWWREMDDWGWAPLDVPFRPVAQRDYRPAHVEWRKRFRKFSAEGQSAQALDALLTYGRQQQVRMILVTTPEGPILRGAAPKHVYRDVDRLLDMLSQKHAVPVIQARTWIDEDDFNDSFHLYPEGAAKFSRRLAQELRPLVHPSIPTFAATRP